MYFTSFHNSAIFSPIQHCAPHAAVVQVAAVGVDCNAVTVLQILCYNSTLCHTGGVFHLFKPPSRTIFLKLIHLPDPFCFSPSLLSTNLDQQFSLSRESAEMLTISIKIFSGSSTCPEDRRINADFKRNLIIHIISY